MGDGTLRHSVHKAATELLYLPIPPGIKKRTKVILDATVDNVATGLGAAIVLAAVAVGISYSQLSLLSLGLIAMRVFFVLRSRTAYVDSFRRAIERREIDLSEFTVDVGEAAALESLIAALDSPQERRVSYALEMLATVRADSLIEPLASLLNHDSPEIRQGALKALQNQSGNIPLLEIECLQQDEHVAVRVEALYCLCLHGPGERSERLRAALQSPEAAIRAAAVGCIAEYGSEREKDLIDEDFLRRLFADRPDQLEERVQAARIIGRLHEPRPESGPESGEPGERPYLREVVRQLMSSSEPAVVHATISSLGQLGDPQYVPWLVGQLDNRRFAATQPVRWRLSQSNRYRRSASASTTRAQRSSRGCERCAPWQKSSIKSA